MNVNVSQANQLSKESHPFKADIQDRVWWCTSVIPAIQEQQDHEFKASLGYTERLCKNQLPPPQHTQKS
jgi:hypothetical protein